MIVIPETEKDVPLELVGGKAKGLFTLKSLEQRLNENGFISYHTEVIVPPFFVVPAQVNLPKEYSHILEQARKIGNLYAVRSSSCLEDNGENSFDGIFDTILNVPLDKLVRTIHQVRKSATSQKARQYAKDMGVELKEIMPVIVQQMVTKQTERGVVYSRFPCPKNILKIIRDSCYENRERQINALLRETNDDGTLGLNPFNPIIISRDWEYRKNEIEILGLVALAVEEEIKHPVIMEFSCYEPNSSSDKFGINPLQARKLTKISDELKFRVPQLHEKGIIASTYDLNGTGDFTGEAFVIPHYETMDISIKVSDLEEFDKSHTGGYVLVAPFLQFYNTDLDWVTPNKKAVVAFTKLGEHHDMEVARKKGILYLNVQDSLSTPFYMGNHKGKRCPIKTGEKIRVTSDGETGYIFNLSRV